MQNHGNGNPNDTFRATDDTRKPRVTRAARQRRAWRNDLRDALAEAYTLRRYSRRIA